MADMNTTTTTNPSSSTGQEEEESSNNYMLYGGITACLIIGGLYYYYYIYKPETETTSSDTSSSSPAVSTSKKSETTTTPPVEETGTDSTLLKTFVMTTNIPTVYADAPVYVPDPKIPNPMIYASSNGCTVSKLPYTDGWNKNGLYFPDPLSYLHMTGFPSGCFKNNWTIEFFVYAPLNGLTLSSSGTSGILCTSPKTTIPITSHPNDKTQDFITIGGGNPQSALKMSRQVIVLESPTNGGLPGGNVKYQAGGWTSVVIQYFTGNTSNNYCIWVTPRGGTSANMVYGNWGAYNIGPTWFQSLALGAMGDATCANGMYLTNLRISNVARYSNAVGANINQPIIWPEDESFVPDQYTTYFNSFNVVDKGGKGGWNYSQVVAGNAYFS
jgi:hypothetical protein